MDGCFRPISRDKGIRANIAVSCTRQINGVAVYMTVSGLLILSRRVHYKTCYVLVKFASRVRSSTCAHGIMELSDNPPNLHIQDGRP